MRIAVLAASGGTDHQLAAQALDRGHSVLALARDPRKVNLPGSADLTVVTADVLEADMAGLLTDVEAVVSGIGIRQGDPAGTLLAGARALAAAAPARAGRGPRLRPTQVKPATSNTAMTGEFS